jgi:hypothetical protein
MKNREPRRPVVLKARLRDSAGWRDACILNLSSSGLMIHTDSAPQRGSILEVRRGDHVIVAQVMWSSDRRAGLKAQHAIAIEALASSAPAPECALSGGGRVDRRAKPRRDDAHQASRERGRAMQFGSLAVSALAGAALAAAAVTSLLDASMAQVAAVLG